jgi:DNA polymerase-3 subunit delta
MAKKAKPSTRCPAIVAISGADEFLKGEAVAEARDAALGGEAAAAGVVECDGRTAQLADVLDTLRTRPLFAERSVVIVHNADPFVSRHRAALESYAASPADCGVLILVLTSLPSNTRLAKAVRKVGRVVHCKAVKYGAVTRWIIDYARRRFGKRVDWPTAELLRDTVGDETGRLAQELEKLSIFVGKDRPIAREDIEALSPLSSVSAAFELTDAIGRKDAAAALTATESMFEADRGAAYRLVGYLAKHVRRLWEARRLYDEGQSPAEICRTVGVSYFADRFVNQVRSFQTPRLAEGFGELQRVDLAIKTGAADPRDAVERFVLQMCRP